MLTAQTLLEDAEQAQENRQAERDYVSFMLDPRHFAGGTTVPNSTSVPPPRTIPVVDLGEQIKHVTRRFATTMGGNYCGPYWSDGNFQPSVDGTSPATGPTDTVCKTHDKCYFDGTDRLQCDLDMYNAPIGNSVVKGAVGLQALARRLYRKMATKQNLRRNKNTSQNTKKNEAAQNNKNAGRRLRKNNTNGAMLQVAPAATSVGIRNYANNPTMVTQGNGISIRHSEMIGSVYVGAGSPTALTSASFVVNAGKFASFPWLATVATNYDRYRFRKLRFSFVPILPTSSSGRVGLGYDYDSSDAAPQSRSDFFSLTRHSEGAVWAPISLDVPTDGVIRFTNTHTTTDSKLIDLGQLIVLTDASNATASSAIGDIICDYVVELIDPQQPTYATLTYTAANPTADTSFTLKGPTCAVMTFVSASVITIAVGPGKYIINTMLEDSGSTTPTFTVTYSNCSLVGSAFSTSSTLATSKTFVVVCANGNGLVTLTAGLALSACEAVNIVVSKVAGDIPTMIV